MTRALPLVLLVALIAAARAEDPLGSWTARLAPAVGRGGDYLIDLRADYAPAGKPSVRLLASYVMHLETLPPEEGDQGLVRQQVTFGAGRVNLGDRQKPLRLEGANYIALRDTTGRVVATPRRLAALPSSVEYLVVSFHDLGFAPVLGETPRAVGEEWTAELHEEPVLFDAENREPGDRTYLATYRARFVEAREVSGAGLLSLHVAETIASRSPGGEAKVEGSLTLTLDAADGWLVQADGELEHFSLVPTQGSGFEIRNLVFSVRPAVRSPQPPTDEDTAKGGTQ